MWNLTLVMAYLICLDCLVNRRHEYLIGRRAD